jgi:hypothetical protein
LRIRFCETAGTRRFSLSQHVVTARHDNYGGDFRERILAPLRFNYERLSERGLEYDVILVEWDPIVGRPLLCEMLAKEEPDITKRVLRAIVVAPEYQAAMMQNPRAGYLEYIAKNVGIRRAASPFVLVTNADIFLGREVVDALADRDTFHRLRGFNEVYRAARAGIDLNFMVKVYSAGVPIADIGGPVYHLNHVGSCAFPRRCTAPTARIPPGGISTGIRPASLTTIRTDGD